MADRTRQIEELFHAAAERAPGERTALLDAACAADPDLRAEVESLLAADERSQTFMEAPPCGKLCEDARAMGSEPEAVAGRVIGGYRLVRVVASGGMGTVYEALQPSPRRTVALKVMRAEIGAPHALRRFQYESELLGRLRHPAIAQIYEAGTHSEGALTIPFFAMEYVPEARSIVTFAAAQRLGTRARLELFAQVCDAVQHGHQKGIIHRDLKPGNILVDGGGAPKVIDFGVARAMDSDAVATITQTGAPQLIGTLQYMSPEQCDLDPAALDTRSDVYALGVVLFELLCGELPYDVTTLSFSQAARTIREDAPRRLSAVNRALRGDLETIVVKTLEKDRERRYSSAADLGQDIRRYLADQAIEARPPSTVYQLRKLVARHKVAFAAMAVLLAALTLFAISMALMYGRAQRNLRRAEGAEKYARAQADTAMRVSNYLMNFFAPLEPSGAGDLLAPQGGALASWDLLDREVGRIRAQLADEPAVQVALLSTLANAYARLEFYARATAVEREALDICRRTSGPDGPSPAAHFYTLGDLLRNKGDYAEAERALGEALAMYRRIGPGGAEGCTNTLAAMAQLHRLRGEFSEAAGLLREVLQRRSARGAGDLEVLATASNLAGVLELGGDFEAAEALFREILAKYRQQFGDSDPHSISALLALGRVLEDRAELTDAEGLYLEAQRLRTTATDDRQRDTLDLIALAHVRTARGDYSAAEAYYREALAICRERHGDDHPSVGSILQALAELTLLSGDLTAIERLSQEADSRQRRAQQSLPKDHPYHSGALLLLGVLRLAAGDAVRAEPLLRECVERRRAALSPEHWLTAYAENLLGGCLTALARYEEAELLLAPSYAKLRSNLRISDERAVQSLQRIVELYQKWGRPAEAERFRALLRHESTEF